MVLIDFANLIDAMPYLCNKLHMKLYCLPQSPYARKAMILIRLKGLDVEELGVERDLVHGYTKGISPVGKIPALVRVGKPVMVDSPVICEFLDGLSEPILPASGEARFEQLRLHALGDALSDAVYNYRFETMRDHSLHWDEIIQRHKNSIDCIITSLEAECDALGAPWAFGNLSIICALDYMGWRAPHVDLAKAAPNLAAWHKTFTKQPVWQDTYIYDAV